MSQLIQNPSPHRTSLIRVALTRCPDYDPASLRRGVAEVLEAASVRPGVGTRVLVKPNLISVKNCGLSCTHPQVVRAVCDYLLDCGCKPVVSDSPAFGRAGQVAAACGLDQALRGSGVAIAEMDRPRPVRLSFGGSIGVSALALDSDLILNLPKLKAHTQMRLTGAVKNLFGCVPGTRKALAHTLHGDKGERFETMLVEIMRALPPASSLLDGIRAMHVMGPMTGEPFDLGLLAASVDPVALDTAVYALLGLRPADLRLWRTLRRLDLPGSRVEDLRFPVLCPADFDASGFRLPERLTPVSFHPLRLLVSSVRRLWRRCLG